MPRRPLSQRLWSLQHRAAPYLFVLPFVLLFAVFLAYPLLQSIVLSLYQSVGTRESRFVGAGNYAFLLREPVFWLAVANTVGFAALFIAVQVPLALGLAILLNHRRVRLRGVFRFAFFSTYLVGQVFASVLFTLLLAPRTGLINRAVGSALPWVGTELNWKGDPALAIPAIVLAAVWLTVGQSMVYLLAGLQAVDRELYEAAAVDGAGPWQRFRHVTLPGIRPVLVYLVLVSTIYALQLFELPFVFFNLGFGPKFRGMTVVGYLYMNGILAGDLGFASAVGWVLFFLISVVAYVQLRVTGAGKEA